MFYRLLPLLLLLPMACSSPQKDGDSSEKQQPALSEAQKIVNAAISEAGGELYDRCDIRFRFRDIEYRGLRKEGLFQYERQFIDEEDTIHDIYSNDGFVRSVNGMEVTVPDSMAVKYTNSVNSVLYFLLLPKPLNDEAVIKEYLGETMIKGKQYHEIKVTFRQDGGGEDFTDEFVYWFEKDSYAMDYFAYLYYTEGGGVRFREAYNRQEVNGITVSDYINFKYEDMSLPIEKLDSVYLAGGLEELSRIEQSEVRISILE